MDHSQVKKKGNGGKDICARPGTANKNINIINIVTGWMSEERC
jgi:hypothetical protein